MDCIVNAILFIAGVIPGHIHGFYIIYTYFYRKRKVKKGRYPGGKKAGIFSEQVWNGGASNEKVRELLLAQRRREAEEEEVRVMKMGRKRSSGFARMVSRGDVGFGAKRAASVRGGDVVMYDREERRPVQRAVL